MRLARRWEGQADRGSDPGSLRSSGAQILVVEDAMAHRELIRSVRELQGAAVQLAGLRYDRVPEAGQDT